MAGPDSRSILKICEFCIESPLACVSGIRGADLKRRVVNIMKGRAGAQLSPAKRSLLVGAAVAILAVPILSGIGNPSRVFASQGILDWENTAGGRQEFEAASVRQDKSEGAPYSNFSLDSGNAYFVPSASDKFSPAGTYLSAKRLPLIRYIVFAYKLSGTQELALRFDVFRGLDTHTPGWTRSTQYDIEARAPGHPTKDQIRMMMQSLLAERFKLAVHAETREARVFALVLAKPGSVGAHLRLHPADDSCRSTTAADDEPATAKNVADLPCGVIAHLPVTHAGAHRFGGRNVPLALLATSLPTQTGMAVLPRPVLDRTGLNGNYDFDVEWTPEDKNPEGDIETGATFRDALRSQLGLKLESASGPIELLVIDHVQPPTEQNDDVSSAGRVAPVALVQEKPAEPPVFEVATIKPDKSGSGILSFNNTPDGIQARGFTAQMLIRAAYGVDDNRISGAPGWLSSDLYDIEAKVAGTDVSLLSKMSPEQRRLMLQPLLMERFQLKVHRETQIRPVYQLVVAKGGLKLKPSPPAEPGVTSEPKLRIKSGQLIAQRLPISLLVQWLALHAGRVVVDKTGVSGIYDFTLRWSLDDGLNSAEEFVSAKETYASLFTALQEQLGLKLEPATGPVEMLVIDHVEKPSEN